MKKTWKGIKTRLLLFM